MNTFTLLAVIALAALIHASFQLSVSMLTLVSSRALGRRARHLQVMNLMSGFTLGAMVMTALMLSAAGFFTFVVFGSYVRPLAWAIACGMMVGVAVAVWVFYYRKRTGTTLWLPRPIARMLHNRVRSTDSGAEAFSLGLTSVIAEVIFSIAPISVAAFSLVHLPHYLQFAAVIAYTVITTGPLLAITFLVGSGKRLSSIQKWRDQNREFMQMAAGVALLVLAVYVYVNIVLAPMWLQGMLH